MAHMEDVLGAKTVETRGEKKTYWTRIGVAFVNDESDSITLYLDYVPISPEIKLIIKEKKDFTKKGEQTNDFADEQI